MSAVAVMAKLEGYASFDEIKQVVEAFEACTLLRAQWTHAAPWLEPDLKALP